MNRLGNSGRRYGGPASAPFQSAAWWSLGVLALPVACSSSAGSDEISLGRAQPALSTSNMSAPTLCSADAITQPGENPICGGPWQYERWGRCTLRDPACGERECLAWNSCRDLVFGREPPRTREVCKTVRECDTPECEIDLSGHLHCEHPICRDVEECHEELVLGPPALGSGPVCGCQSSDFPECSLVHPSCAPDPVILESASGLSLQQLQGTAQFSAKFSPVCSTCDTLPMGTPGEAAAKYVCLSTRFRGLEAQTGNDPARFGELAERLILLSELAGEHLSADERAFARTMYTRFPSSELACGSVAQPGAEEIPAQSCPSEFGGSFDRCQRLALDHASPELAALEAEQCISLVRQLSEILDEPGGSACASVAVREAVIDASQRVLLKSFQVVGSPSSLSSASDLASLARRLFDLDRWVAAIDSVYLRVGSAGGGDAEAARRVGYDRESAALAALYQRVQTGYDVFGALANANVAGLELALQGVTERGLAMDREVLIAAFTPVGVFAALQESGRTVLDPIPVHRAPLSGQALLLLLSDSLGGLTRRMDDLNAFHAFACRFRECGSHTRLSDLWSLVAALEDPAELRQRLDAIPKSASLDPLDGWWQVFDLLQRQHGTLRSAISLLTGGAALAATPAENLPAQVRPLAERIRRATALYESYVNRGQLVAAEGRTLFAGQESQQRGQLRDLLLQRVDRLAQEADNYRSSLGTLVSGLRTEVEEGATLERLQREKLRVADQIDQHLADVTGLSASAQADEARFDTIGARFSEIELTLDDGELLKLGDPPTADFEFSGASAAFSGQHHGIPTLAAAAPLTARAGQIVTLSTTGEWSPTCALRAVNFLHGLGHGSETMNGVVGAFIDNLNSLSGGTTPDGQVLPLPVNVEGALAGPEGFRLVETASGFEAASATSGSSLGAHVQVDRTLKACVKSPLGGVVGTEVEACLTLNSGVGWKGSLDEQHSSGYDSRSSASFASGLRLSHPWVPFPAFPVGSLLVVEMPPGAVDLSQMVDVHVVRAPQTSIVMRADSDLYFVVNDLACPDADHDNRLQMRVGRLTSAGVVAPVVVAQMARTLGYLREQTSLLVAQGELLPSQQAAFRSDAVLELEAKLAAAGVPLTFRDLPEPLKDLFAAFLDKEVVGIERAVRLFQHTRQLELLFEQLNELQGETRNVEQIGRVDRLIPSWTLRNLDAEGMRERAGQTLEAFRKHLYPILDLWYPSALQKLHADSGQSGVIVKLNRLRDAGINESVLDLTEVATEAMRDILSEYTLAEPGDPGMGTVALALSHPNPCAIQGDFGQPPPLSDLPKAERKAATAAQGPTRSEALWQAVYSGGKGRFVITPEDVYRRNGGSAGELSCNVATPVIRQLAVVVVSKDTSAESEDRMRQLNQGRWLQGTTAALQPFLSEHGPVTYVLGDYRRQEFQIPLIYVPYDTALTSFNQAMRERLEPLGGSDALFIGPSGLSPFAEIDVDFSLFESLKHSSVGTGLEDAVEIAVMGVVEGRPTAPLDWIRTCEPGFVPPAPVSSSQVSAPPEFCPPD